MRNALAPVQGPRLRRADRVIRSLRLRQVDRFLPAEARVLDVGCYDGALFARYADRIASGVGLDPLLASSGTRGKFRFVADGFPSDALKDERFDVITFLAVLEHVRATELAAWPDACNRLLAPGGVVVATVPSPRVDDILHVLIRLHLVEGMSVHEHHGFDPGRVPAAFASTTLSLVAQRRFELGLNNLYVFRKERV
jgi:2-polyprenyl-3-methyl-5-hydroxy-6-metoxy-1,4-benzoquinol methylase